MRILAVIPACEGSVNLPNKNIRVINGKPLIYYVIHNAKRSRYITDTIVTTNSQEIITIAKQMGVMFKLRDSSLCSEDVPLDTVVYDVFREVELTCYDYVVTMQSISPTLRVETLDAALEKCIHEDCDTMISVANRPRFYWTSTEHGVVPIHDQRKSRHRLPPFFAETGAFLITKSCFVQQDSRLGKNVQLFTLNGDEAVDVDTFGDLKQVENILCRKTVAFYVNGNHQLGLGHVHRVLQIADELFTKPDIYFDENQTHISVFGDTTHRLRPVNGPKAFLEMVSKQTYDLIVNDVLSTSAQYMKVLQGAAPQSKIINFEDEGEGAIYADCVINALYESSSQKNAHVGSQYYIVPKLFLLYEPIAIKERVQNVIATFGGADPNGYTEKVLQIAVKPAFQNVHFYVVLGKAKRNVERLLEYNQYRNIDVLHDINNMPEMMAQCDVAITSRGRTGFELAVLGIPTISMAQNAREEKHDFMCEKNGFTYLGYNPSNQIIEQVLYRYINLSMDERLSHQQTLLKNNLRNGRKNVMDLIERI